MFNKNKNPFFQHSECEYFLAYKNGEVVGMIASLVNHNHNKFHEEKTGFLDFLNLSMMQLLHRLFLVLLKIGFVKKKWTECEVQ